MHILALETSTLVGSAAALDDQLLMEQIDLPSDRRTAQTLHGAIAELLQRVGWRPGDVDLIAVTQGPGSFTGLRIGVTTAKVFAYAANTQVAGVNTLEAIAARAAREDEQTRADRSLSLFAVISAQRGELFSARFVCRADQQQQMQPPVKLISREQWLSELPQQAVVTGQGRSEILQPLPPGVRVVDSSFWHPQAEDVGRIGLRVAQDGRCDDYWTLTPNYYRPSAAEEKFGPNPTASRRDP